MHQTGAITLAGQIAYTAQGTSGTSVSDGIIDAAWARPDALLSSGTGLWFAIDTESFTIQADGTDQHRHTCSICAHASPAFVLLSRPEYLT